MCRLELLFLIFLAATCHDVLFFQRVENNTLLVITSLHPKGTDTEGNTEQKRHPKRLISQIVSPLLES